jgi:hypothetical protein
LWCLDRYAISRLVAVEEVNSNAKPGENSVPLILSERFDLYPWSNGTNLVFKRGPALIFSQSYNHLAKNIEVALKHIEYSPTVYRLQETEATLKNSNF